MLMLLCALQLATLAPLTPVAQRQLLAPTAFHSVGFEWQDGYEGLEAAILAADGTIEPWWPVVEAADMRISQVGGKRYAALVHGSSSTSVGVLLRGVAAKSLATIQVFWVPASTPLALAVQPPIYNRSSWGANPANCAPTYCNTTHIALHHTASASEYASSSWAQCAANVKATQVYHMVTRGWCDIGYNYLICPHGDVFEGRGGGDNVRGAHDGFNCGSMGVAMMGYFHTPYNQTLTMPMKDSFVDLAAWKCAQQNIQPLGSSWYAGLGAVEQNMYGHRDVSNTACPGDFAYAELPWLRARVDALLNGGGTEIILDNGAAVYSGNWTTSNSAAGHYGPDYRWANTGTAPARALWTVNIPSAGRYQVAMWWPAGSNRYPATLVGVALHSSIYTTTINQQINGGQWNVLGSVSLAGGANTFGMSNAGALGWVVVADALRLIKL